MYRQETKPWKNEKPTLIPTPGKSGNPFARNPNRARLSETGTAATLGSVSTKTSRNSYTEESGPSHKRRKLNGNAVKNKYSASRPPLAPEEPEENSVIYVSDGEENSPERKSYSKLRRSSPDELILASQPSSTSKYFAGETDPKKGRHSNTDLAQDGPDTTWARNHFSKDQHSEIEQFSDSPVSFPRKGHPKGVVKEIVDVLEMRDQHSRPSPKIDLSTVQKPHSRVKINMKPKFPTSQGTRVASASMANRERFDPVPVLTTHTEKERGPLPVEKLFLDNVFYPQAKGQKVKLFWNTDGFIVLEANESKVYKLRLRPESWSSFILSELPDTVLQLRPLTGHHLVTIKLGTDASELRPKDYDDFRKMIFRVVKPEIVKDGARLVEAAGMVRPDDTANRMDLLRQVQQNRKPPSLGPAPESRKRRASSVIPSTPPPTNPPGSSSVRLESAEDSTKFRPPVIPDTTSTGLRRSSRKVPPAPEKSKPTEPDELILVYPPGPGAVNITNGDLDRLQPHEFLNDTLIEFGLKLWLKDLAASNPTLASQIHIFNSFFYKKLNGAKDVNQAFESVRKWTSKFDLFAKKYIIVPINEHLHWYLAIICEPEHILSGKKAMTPVVRKQTRSSAQAGAVIPAPVETQPEVDDPDDQIVTSSEAEVERSLHDNFRSSCIIEPNGMEPGSSADIVDAKGAESPATLSYATDEADDIAGPGTIHTSSRRSSASASSSIYMVIDSHEDGDGTRNYVPVEAPNPPPALNKRMMGKEKVIPEPDVQMVEVDVEEIPSQQQTLIFVMDSLGTRHPQAVKKLAIYLALEAKDKKGIEIPGDVEGKFVLVPVQPNFCDCGLYLLHFAQTFMSNPVYYINHILAQPKQVPNPERQKFWKDGQVAQMRQNLSEKIKQLSKHWKRERTKEEPPTSDDEVEIVEKKSAKKPVKSQARRIRG